MSLFASMCCSRDKRGANILELICNEALPKNAMQSVAECCRVLQSVAERCRALQGVAECCRVLQSVADCCRVLQSDAMCCSSVICGVWGGFD